MSTSEPPVGGQPAMPPPPPPPSDEYPVQFAVDYPDRPLNRLTTFFRIFTVIPIAIVLGCIGGFETGGSYDSSDAPTIVIGG